MGLLAFTLIPLAWAVWISLTDEQLFVPGRFIGLQNYVQIFTADEFFRKSLLVTLRWVILTTPLFLVAGLLLSLVLNQKLRGMRVFRTILYIPAVLSGVAVGIVWLNLFNPDLGAINFFLYELGVENPPYWFQDPDWAMPALAVVGLWGIGGGAVIYLAGLQNIPPHLYEAASIDGAGPVRKFFDITLPMISPTIFFVLITSVIEAFQVFGVVFVHHRQRRDRRSRQRPPLLHALHVAAGVPRGQPGLRRGPRLDPDHDRAGDRLAPVPPREAVRLLRKPVGGNDGDGTPEPAAGGWRRGGRLAEGPQALHAAAVYALLGLLCLFILLPIGWMLTAALKPDTAPVFTFPPEWFPTQYWHWPTFVQALTNPDRPFLRYAANSALISGLAIVGSVLSCSLIAFPFARLRFRGRDKLFAVVLATMLLPGPILVIPQFLLFFRIGWYGTYLPLIVPWFAGNAFLIFLVRQYMRTIPGTWTRRPGSTAPATGRSTGRSSCPCLPRRWRSWPSSPSSGPGTTSSPRCSTSTRKSGSPWRSPWRRSCARPVACSGMR